MLNESAAAIQPEHQLSHKQKRAIAALLTSPTQREAAKQAGVTEKTISVWMQDQAFKAALGEAEAEMVNAAALAMAGAMTEAVEVLRRIMANVDAPLQDRRSAATAILRYAPQVRLLGSIEQRLAELEDEVTDDLVDWSNQR